MSQKIDTPNPITAAEFTAIDTSSAAIEAILVAANVPLTETQTNAIIAVSTVRSAQIVVLAQYHRQHFVFNMFHSNYLLSKNSN